MVAVLHRRGRFLTAEPLFARPEQSARGAGGRAGSSISIGQGRGAGASAGAGDGDLVLLRLGARGSAVRVLRKLGRPDVAGDVIEALLLDRGLQRVFPDQLEAEARSAGKRVMGSPGERRDLQELATFTIDPVGARDFDDAISAEPLGEGIVRVWVHIADVAAHVPEGSAIDIEAKRRATSVYVPGTVEPMLPHALSSDACSLVPGVTRTAVTVELELDGAHVRRAAFYRSLIRSDQRLDYERVDRIFAGQDRAEEPWAGALSAARGAAAALQGAREQSGALALDSAEPEFEFDKRGHVKTIHARTQTESHRLIEHLMIAANEAVASMLAQRRIPCLYRVHERPEPERVTRLADQLASLKVPTPPVPDPLSASQAAELMGAISVAVRKHVERAGGRGRLGLSSLLLRTLKQAYYSPQNLGHAGLGSTAYCHFTSPIRRYPDLVCHRALLAAVGGGERAPRAEELVALGTWTSEREREAMVIERDGDDVASCFALEGVLRRDGFGQILPGEITGLISAGAFIAFAAPGKRADPSREPPPFEGMLPVRLLRAPREHDGPPRSQPGRSRRGAAARGREDGPREWWELNEQGTILKGERTGTTLRLGDAVKVRVARVDAVRGRVDLEPAG
jgi:ribonuclease R